MAARHRKTSPLLRHEDLAEHLFALGGHHLNIAKRKKRPRKHEDHLAPVGQRSAGRADKFRRGTGGRADKHPWSSAAQGGIDTARTTASIGRNPGGTGGGSDAPAQHRPGEHTQAVSHEYFGSYRHRAGGRHPHHLIGKHGQRDHPGHHFAEGGPVAEVTQHGPWRRVYSGRGSNVHRDAAQRGQHLMDGGPVRRSYMGPTNVEHEARETGAAHGGAIVHEEHHHFHDEDGNHVRSEKHTHYEDGSVEVEHRGPVPHHKRRAFWETADKEELEE